MDIQLILQSCKNVCRGNLFIDPLTEDTPSPFWRYCVNRLYNSCYFCSLEHDLTLAKSSDYDESVHMFYREGW